MARSTLSKRIAQGWAVERALTAPAARGARRLRSLTLRGKTQGLTAWAVEVGLGHSRLSWRLRQGWDLTRALTSPAATPIPVEEDLPDLLDDVLAGESCARALAERYGVSARTVVRVRARLRAQGRRVRVPER